MKKFNRLEAIAELYCINQTDELLQTLWEELLLFYPEWKDFADGEERADLCIQNVLYELGIVGFSRAIACLQLQCPLCARLICNTAQYVPTTKAIVRACEELDKGRYYAIQYVEVLNNVRLRSIEHFITTHQMLLRIYSKMPKSFVYSEYSPEQNALLYCKDTDGWKTL